MARLVAVLASLVLGTLVACGASNREPAWPKRTDPEVDGGESLAPRSASVVAVSAEKKEAKTEEKADENEKDKPADAKAADKDKPADAKPAATTTTTDDVIIIDDIIIEIDD